jgi:hypothetical protein
MKENMKKEKREKKGKMELDLRILREGDIVQHTVSGADYIVIQVYPHIIAIRTLTITNPTEWILIEK